jgi:glycosyltransferase involved in cell wall biosynthesis
MRLQPWLTLVEVGRRLQEGGHEVTLVTDGSRDEALPFPTQRFRSLRGTETAAIRSWLRLHQPDACVVSITPFSLATATWHQALNPQHTWGFLSYALYNPSEISQAWMHLGGSDRWGYGRNLLVPSSFWRNRLARRFKGVLCQSQRTKDRVGPGIRCEVIPPGIDSSFWTPAETTGSSERDFLYVGSMRSIRGCGVLLEAMRRTQDARLTILARGLPTEELAQLQGRLKAMGLSERVKVRGGWLSPLELRDEVRRAVAVVLPFVLVPSEVPVSVMEAVACHTPVIVSDIDGLPEAAGGAGRVVRPGDPVSLADAMNEIRGSPSQRQALRSACAGQVGRYSDWSAVSRQWEGLFREAGDAAGVDCGKVGS